MSLRVRKPKNVIKKQMNAYKRRIWSANIACKPLPIDVRKKLNKDTKSSQVLHKNILTSASHALSEKDICHLLTIPKYRDLLIKSHMDVLQKIAIPFVERHIPAAYETAIDKQEALLMAEQAEHAKWMEVAKTMMIYKIPLTMQTRYHPFIKHPGQIITSVKRNTIRLQSGQRLNHMWKSNIYTVCRINYRNVPTTFKELIKHLDDNVSALVIKYLVS